MIVRPRRGGTEDGGVVPVRRLVVPLDGSELAAHALPVAHGLAKRLGLPVLLVNVVGPSAAISPLVAGGAPSAPPVADHLRAETRDEAERKLERASRRFETAGIAVGRQVLDGAAAALLDLMRPDDVVVMTSHGRSGLGRWLLGSVAEKLVRHGAAPVLLVRPGAPGREP